MSDLRLHQLRSASGHVDALAAWVLLGWLGMRLGWSVASGVLPVVVWWVVRGAAGGVHLRRGAGVAGLWLAMLSLAFTASGLTRSNGLALLLVASAGWGLWSAMLSDHDNAPSLPLARLGMGLMMGSLWLSSQWCLGPGWTDAQAVALHLGLMVGLPLAVSMARHHAGTGPTLGRRPLLALLAVGALLLANANTSVGHIAGMALVVFGAALNVPPHAARPSGLVGRLLGPLLLLAVGLTAPALGPAALQAAWAVVALLSAAQALRPAVPFWPLFSSPHRWSDAS